MTQRMGAVVPIVTPVDAMGRPDTAAVAEVASAVSAAGCRHVMVCGSTGRGPWFSPADRARICRAARPAIPASTLLAGCMGAGVEEILANIDAMAMAGADIAVVTAPYYFRYSPVEIERILITVAERAVLPILLYDIPEFVDSGLTVTALARLLAHRNIVGLKDSSAGIERFRALASALVDTETILLQGKEPLLAESLGLGASGFVVSFVHCHPAAFAALADRATPNDTSAAQPLQAAVTAVYQRYVASIAEHAAPQTSSLFFFLEHALRLSGLDVRLTLAHEGNPADWTIELAEYAVSTLADALTATEYPR